MVYPWNSKGSVAERRPSGVMEDIRMDSAITASKYGILRKWRDFKRSSDRKRADCLLSSVEPTLVYQLTLAVYQFPQRIQFLCTIFAEREDM